MNKNSRIISCIIFLAVLTATPSVLAQAGKLVGVWKVIEVKVPEVPAINQKSHTITDPQPNLYIFTKRHFSIQEIQSNTPRTDLPAPKEATNVQLVAAWKPFNAGSGTYEVEGSTIISHIIVSKDPNVMHIGVAPPIEFKFEGETLLLTVPLGRRPNTPKLEYKLKRLE